MAAPDAMLHWLAQAAQKARKAGDRKQVHIAAEADKDQSTIYRFEQGGGWPRDTDLIVAAYAADLGFEPIELWEMAIKLWREYLAEEAQRISDLPSDARAALEAESPAPRTPSRGRGGRTKRSGGRADKPDR